MLPQLLTSLLSFASLTYAAPQAFPFDQTVQILGKRQTADSPTPTTPFPVTGVLTSGVNPRLEIRQLAANTDQFNIFLLGLQALQLDSETYFLSYYQLAAIHGAPAVAWNNVQGIPAADHGQNYPGYCPHQSNIFLPWHRPYLAVFEQMVVSNAQQIAASFPDGPQKDSYIAAASTLRIPYWDWAMDVGSGQDAFPDIVSNPTVEVTTANGTQTIANPLYSYNFQTASGRQGLTWFPYVDWSQTLRWPTAFTADAITNSAALNSNVNSMQQNNKQRIYAMLTGNANFTEIGTNPYISNSANSYDSFESVHDQVHVSIGGSNYGDMSIIAVSAYDPSFWLHHAMVDRVFSLWQALYPDSYVEPSRQWMPSFWFENGTILDANSALEPFYSDPSGSFWTSNTVREVNTFGYTYPELQSGNVADLKTAINNLYGTGTIFQVGKAKRTSASSEVDRIYRLIFQAPKGRLPSTYRLYFFLGDPTSEDSTEWLDDPNLLGSQAFLQGQVPGPMLAPVTVTGVAPLNSKLSQLVSEGRLASLALDDVLNLLSGNMTFRVMMINNTEAQLDLIPELKVGLSSIQCIPPSSIDEFPTYVGDWDVHYSVTQGQQGGMNGPEDV